MGESEAYLYHLGRQFVWSVLRFFASFVLFCLSICFLLVYDTLLPSTGGWAHIFSASLDIKMLESVIDSSFSSHH